MNAHRTFQSLLSVRGAHSCVGYTAADDPLSGIGLEVIDPRRLLGQPLPDRQEQVGDDMDGAVGEFRALGEFARSRNPRQSGASVAHSIACGFPEVSCWFSTTASA